MCSVIKEESGVKKMNLENFFVFIIGFGISFIVGFIVGNIVRKRK